MNIRPDDRQYSEPKQCFSSCNTAAFTVIELLIVVLIIGLLLSLTLPATLFAVESSRRAACKNNVKQIATAFLSHEDSHGYYPSGGWSGEFIGDSSSGFGRKQPGSWLFSVLPYAEEHSLWDRAVPDFADASASTDIVKFAAASPSILYCPSRRQPRAYPTKRSGNGRFEVINYASLKSGSRLAKSDYAANSGTALVSSALGFSKETSMWTPMKGTKEKAKWTATDNERSIFFQDGVSFYRSEVRSTQLARGTTHTMCAGEKKLSYDIYKNPNNNDSVGCLGDNQSAWSGYEWDNHRVAWNPLSKIRESYYLPSRDSLKGGLSNIYAFGSIHTDSMNMGFCDGSVRNISYDIDGIVYRSIASTR